MIQLLMGLQTAEMVMLQMALALVNAGLLLWTWVLVNRFCEILKSASRVVDKLERENRWMR